MSSHVPTKFQPIPFIISVAITLTIGFVASYFTRPEIAGWYATLHKPTFTPPSWAFPVAWTVIYILIATSAYLVWQKRDGSANYKRARLIYFIQLFVNFSWSIIFFGMHQILGALIIIIILWLYILLNIFSFSKFSLTAARLLIPYLLWVTFATALNYSIYILNR